MKLLFISALLVIISGVFFFDGVVEHLASRNVTPAEAPVAVPNESQTETDTQGSVENEPASVTSDIPEKTIVAENLTIPWDVVFLPGGSLLVAERPGRIVRIDQESGLVGEVAVPDVSHRGEGGLLGMVLHPNFTENHFLYLYLTTTPADSARTINTVMRFRYQNDELTDPNVIVDDIPGALYHDGGRMAFGPDGMLYVTTGDATEPHLAQDLQSLAGKILRMTDEGGVPEDNPFGTLVYSYGHRNPQGLTWDDAGRLWSTEHGRSGVRSGLDELNLIKPGGNYGWPESEGDTVRSGTVAPVLHSGSDTTWAPASAQYYNGSVYFAGLRGETLYEAVLDGTKIVSLREHFADEYGRLRTILLGPDKTLYLTTSNRDGRGDVRQGDDKIIRLNPEQF